MKFFKKNKQTFLIFSTVIIVAVYAGFLALSATRLKAQDVDNDTCLGCHEDKTLTVTHGKKTISLFIDKKKLQKSIHAGVKCIQCHAGLDPENQPHSPNPRKVSCGNCHKSEQSLYNDCMHGKASNKGDQLAPKCQTCHGSHEIVANKEKKSPVYPLNIPKLCGQCHREGSPVQMQRNIPESHILENYQESIHGEALLKKGLTVTATCASCHSPHRVLPHTDPRSTINRKNIAATCTRCHSTIEIVHKKVIKGELWQKEAKVLPACIDCHQPHKARKVFYEANLADAQCKKCHETQGVKSHEGKSMFVNSSDLAGSIHSKIACAQCHTNIDPTHKRPCDNISKKVDCGSCHTAVGDDYRQSLHGMMLARNDKNAPACADCHGTHHILKRTDPKSTVFALNIPGLCSRCHQEGKRVQRYFKGPEHQITENYSESIHGKGLIKSGLTVTATCADCHTAHRGLPPTYPNSSVNPVNIAKTCGNCHFGVQEQFAKSVHSPLVTKTDKKLPVCNDCHTAHTIKRTDANSFRQEILQSCGKCHKEISETYFDTYHGKVSRLGSNRAAKCNDCHGSHDILPADDLNSHLSRTNIVQTCKKCHPNATKGFTRYLTHATHHDNKKYPFLFFTFWGMTLLLIGTFSLSFLHTLLWLPRSFQFRKQMKVFHAEHPENDEKRYTRFSPLERSLHFVMIISFLTLATTGLIIKFSYTAFAGALVKFLGGTEQAGIIHRFGATMLFAIFILHVIDLFRKKRTEFKSWKDMLFGQETMLPTMKDLRDAAGSFKWFLGKGPRPDYGRWTYWEKFDYFAVFWGIFVIGFTGLTLWFPEFFTRFMPGWLLNVSTIIHSDEALLAAGFIFTVHFFNTHFRPEKFPMDTVIFSGQMTVEELKIERPAEYQYLVDRNILDTYMRAPFSPSLMKLLRIFGWCALTIGLSLVVWIIYAMIFA